MGKPKQDLVFKKSGDTFVMRCDSIDYLCMEPPMHEFRNKTFSAFRDKEVLPDWWKPFSEIEITDDIALLRPMVCNEYGRLEKLYGIAPITTAVTSEGINPLYNYRLATIKEL